MKRNPLTDYFGLTRKQLWMLLGVGGVLMCIIVLYPLYRLYPLGRILFPGPTPTPTIPELSISSPAAYIPAPSLTGWPSGTPPYLLPTLTPTRAPTNTPTLRPTRTPSLTPSITPTRTPSLTPTNTATRTPSKTPTSTATSTSSPTATLAPAGTYLNPVPVGSSFSLPDLGTLAVVQSSWSPGQTGLAIVELSFTCQPPSGRQCRPTDLIIHVEGASGHSYVRDFSPAIPEPAFGTDPLTRLGAGDTERGYYGFVVSEEESSLRMSVQVFLQQGETFFWLQAAPPAE